MKSRIKFGKMEKLIVIVLLISGSAYSCMDALKTSAEVNKLGEDSVSVENLRKTELSKRDSLMRANEEAYFKSIAHIKNINGFTELGKDRLTFLLDSLPLVKLPIGDEEAFFFNYPETQEAEYGASSEHGETYEQDSIATLMSERAFSLFQSQINKLSENASVNELELLLDSTLVHHKKGLPLSFSGILQKNKDFTVFLYENSFEYDVSNAYSYYAITAGANGEIIDYHGLTEFIHHYLFDGIYTNDLNYLNSEGLLFTKQFIVYAKTESTSDFLNYRIHKIDENGNILRYFELENGFFEKEYSPVHCQKLYALLEYEKGEIVNHRKHGGWQEISMRYEDNTQTSYKLKTPVFIDAEYKNGLRHGFWKFYNLQCDSVFSEHGFWGLKYTNNRGSTLLKTLKYEEGKLISKN